MNNLTLLSQDAITLKMISQNHDRLTVLQSSDNNSAAVFDRVVFIDSTWQQCHQIITVSTADTAIINLKLINNLNVTLSILWFG